MRVGWLVDQADMVGGAELTQAEFRAAAPDGVQITELPPGSVSAVTCDRYVIHNCVQYTHWDVEAIDIDKPIVKYWHDVGPHLQSGVREWLDEFAVAICCSPIQAEFMGLEDALCIPPAVDLDRFEQAAARSNGNRKGAVCVGSWRNFGKAPHKVAEWAAQNDTEVQFYGGGIAAPRGSQQVSYEDMPDLLASFETFVFLPTVIEPFSRTVVEAWASGCEVVTNNLVGARHWIEEDPKAMETAARDFWAAVLG